jgi:hypothetical protein
MRAETVAAVCTAWLVASLAQPAFGQSDVLTRRYDNRRSGANIHETALTRSNVRTRFHKLWTLYADAKIMAQPLYVSNLRVPATRIAGAKAKTRCQSPCNAVIVATMKGTVYAYMADEKPESRDDTLLWATYLSDNHACKCGATGPQNGNADFDMWAVDDPWWGVLSTPVVDRATNSLYVVDWTNDQQYRIYNLNLTTGDIQKGPVVVSGQIGNQTFAVGPNGPPQLRKQRAALLLSNGLLYVAFGGDNHEGLAGWLFVYDAPTLALKTIWSPTPAGRNGGIWMAGDGPAADDAGNVYLQSGDGDLNESARSFGESLLKLHFENGGVAVKGFFAPCNQMLLTACDLDQGSSGPVLFDDFVVAGGKNGVLYLMRRDAMAGYAPGPFPPPAAACLPGQPDCKDGPNLLQKWPVASGHIHGAPVVWKSASNQTWLYVMGEGDQLKAFPFAGTAFSIQGMKKAPLRQPMLNAVPACQSDANHGMWMPGGLLTLSSNGATPGSGILWALVPANGDSNSCRGVKGMLVAFNADDVTEELWRSQGRDAALSDTADSFGLLARFNPPIVANGKVFVPTAGDAEPLRRFAGQRPAAGPANYYLAVYGLKQ